MHCFRVCWIPLMGMSCFLVQTWMHIIKVSCFSIHFCSQLLPISCFVCIVCIFCRYLCDSVLVRCSLWQAVPESSWYFNAIFRCFLSAVYGNVVFLQCLLTSVWCFNRILQVLLKTVYENVVFSRSKMHARHKSLVFFRSLAICSCSLRLCKALWGFWRYWKSLGWFGRFWKALRALGGFVRLLSLIHIWRCRRSYACRSRWSPYH